MKRRSRSKNDASWHPSVPLSDLARSTAAFGRHGSYITGKFEEAVRILATERGTINDRLLSAGKVLLEFPAEHDLPTVDGVDKDIRWILGRLTRREAPPFHTRIAASLHGSKDGPKIAGRMFRAWRKLDIFNAERRGREDALREFRHPGGGPERGDAGIPVSSVRPPPRVR
jgi:hypothetical protein